jgi:hypothetical protein
MFPRADSGVVQQGCRGRTKTGYSSIHHVWAAVRVTYLEKDGLGEYLCSSAKEQGQNPFRVTKTGCQIQV